MVSSLHLYCSMLIPFDRLCVSESPVNFENGIHSFRELVKVILNSFGRYSGVRFGKPANDNCFASVSTLDGDRGLFSRSIGVVPSASDALF